ncbi:MAG: helix-hairpin-helix domain-containing protein, partial [Prevotellaceae bacterium]|nr:helix-hairpin-helix domain-containing protein [Prevotellaceae bacterium]
MLVPVSAAVAQDKDLSALISGIAESIADKAESEDEVMGMEQLIEHYTHLAENPLNINTATAEELAQLIILTDFQIFSISEYIKEFGALMSVHELLLVPGFDEETVSRISPFITSALEQKLFLPSFKDMLTKGNSTLLMRSTKVLEKREGYTRDDPDLQRYEGSPFSLLTRYRYRYSNALQIGVTADKDAGEEFFRGSNRRGFDFYSFHIMLSNRKYLKKLIVGDFRANFGQGLAVWNNFSFNKSTDVHSIKKRNNGFSAYSSADEVTYMRGIASTLQFGSWTFSPFISYRKIDATLDGDGYTSL